jgi:hypothetical protein
MLRKLRWSEFPCFPHDPSDPFASANSPGVTSALPHVDATWICACKLPVGNSMKHRTNERDYIGDVSVVSLKAVVYSGFICVCVFFWKYSYPKNSPHDQKWSECSDFGHRGNRHSHPKNRKYHIRLLVMYPVIFNYILLYSHINHVVFGWRIVFKPIYFAFVEQVLKLVWGYHGKSTWNPRESSRVPRHVETECTCSKHTPLNKTETSVQCKHHFMDCITHPDWDRFIICYNDLMNDIMIYIHIMYT